MAPHEIPSVYAQTAKKIDAAIAQLEEIRDEFFDYLDDQRLTLNEFKLLQSAAAYALDALERIARAHSKYTKGFLITFAYEGTARIRRGGMRIDEQARDERPA